LYIEIRRTEHFKVRPYSYTGKGLTGNFMAISWLGVFIFISKSGDITQKEA